MRSPLAAGRIERIQAPDGATLITAADLQASAPEIKKGDIVVIVTGWHHRYADSAEYYAYSPGFYKEAGEWFAA